MKCEEMVAKIDKWQETGTLEMAERGETISHVQSCSLCRRRFGALLPFAAGDAAVRAAAALSERTPDIASRVMRRIEERRLSAADAGKRSIILRRPAAAALFVLIALVVPLFLLPTLRGRGEVFVSFVVEIPEARSVGLVGDFSDWKPDVHALTKKTESGRWEIRLKLKKGGIYTYNFVVDGEKWIPDPTVPFRVKDGLGGESTLLQL